MKSRLLGRLFVAASALPSVACSNDLPRASRIDDLRVVAVHADQPYAHPGETVSLDALAVDPKGRAITWGWATCEDPDDSSALGCIDALQKRRESGEDVRLTTGAELDRFDVTVDADILSGVDPAHLDRSMIGVVVVACPGILDDAILADTSAADPVPVSCRDPVSGERLSSFDFVVGTKRLFVREKDRNSNPVIDGVFFDGAPWPGSSSPRWTLAP